jgi:predicted metal-binding membrane protein
MTDQTHGSFAYLPPAAAGLGHILARPKWIAAACAVTMAALGWTALGIMTARYGTNARMLDAICGSFASAPLTVDTAVLAAGMWTAMVLAMMLPSAAPMLLTYAEIADTAARKGEHVVSPLVLAAGYTTAWLVFAAIATLGQLLLAHAVPLGNHSGAVSGLLSGATFIVTGLYQFSTLKHACLTQCRQPFPFFFTNWTTAPRGVFRLGLKQGLYCVGCCWAMMLLMLAVGVMNVLWMAGLGIVMTLEKMGSGERLSRVVGAALLAIGTVVVGASFAAYWPGRPI